METVTMGGGTIRKAIMLVGMMRVKNEAQWISRAVRPLLEVCDMVFVMDDGSTDRTREIVEAMGGCTLIRSPFETLDESRDKTFLLREIEKYTAPGPESLDWVICVDGDEEIVREDWKKFERPLSKEHVSYSFQILTLYDNPKQIRVDPPYGNMLRPSMFRLIMSGMTFKSSARHGGGFHCSNVPADIGFGVRVHHPEPVRVKHYGYLEKETREKKYKFYMAHDPGHGDWYKRECHGVPTLAPLPEGL